MRVLDRPHRITGIDADAHELRTGRLNEAFQFSRLHVAGVVLDRDLDAGIHDFRAHVLQHADRRLDVLLDSARAVGLAAQYTADDGRAHDLRGVDHASEWLLGRALRRIE